MSVIVEGIVVEGDHRGRQLGFPTANVLPDSDVPLPDEGVYGGHVDRADGTRYVSAISVGRRPTFYDAAGPCLVEAYLLDFDGDLYGERLRVEITDLVRPQQRFSSTEELIEQIKADVAAVRSMMRATVTD
jgi:riboflavin kinase/FMN adenylyltransferase